MPFQLSEVQSREEYLQFFGKLFWNSYSFPHNSLVECCKGPSPEECAVRYWAFHEAVPGGRHIKVTDTATGEVVGYSKWNYYKERPYDKKPQAPLAFWWPEGDLKNISDQMVAQFYNDRFERTNRPHVLLNLLFVSTKARRRGVSKIMMEWGLKTADELGLEILVESAPAGVPLYKSFGFVEVAHTMLDAKTESPTDSWLEVYKKVRPEPFRIPLMWRPKYGKFELSTRFDIEK